MRDSLSTGPDIAGLGYAMFYGAMLALRLAGNRLLTRYSPGRFLASSAAVATVGFGAALLIGTPVAAMIGLVFLGVGLACFVPTVISLAGKLPNVDHGPAIAAVSAFGWVAFVAGPPLIGWVADATSLPLALGLIPALTALLVVMAIRGGEGQRGTEEPAGAAVSVAHELVRD